MKKIILTLFVCILMTMTGFAISEPEGLITQPSILEKFFSNDWSFSIVTSGATQPAGWTCGSFSLSKIFYTSTYTTSTNWNLGNICGDKSAVWLFRCTDSSCSNRYKDTIGYKQGSTLPTFTGLYGGTYYRYDCYDCSSSTTTTPTNIPIAPKCILVEGGYCISTDLIDCYSYNCNKPNLCEYWYTTSNECVYNLAYFNSATNVIQKQYSISCQGTTCSCIEKSGGTYTDLNVCKSNLPAVQTTNTDSCSDSDSGKTYNVRGQIDWHYDGRVGMNLDYCSDSSKLIEEYCSGNQPLSEMYTCPNGCKDGKCIQQEIARPQCYKCDKQSYEELNYYYIQTTSDINSNCPTGFSKTIPSESSCFQTIKCWQCLDSGTVFGTTEKIFIGEEKVCKVGSTVQISAQSCIDSVATTEKQETNNLCTEDILCTDGTIKQACIEGKLGNENDCASAILCTQENCKEIVTEKDCTNKLFIKLQGSCVAASTCDIKKDDISYSDLETCKADLNFGDWLISLWYSFLNLFKN